ncbi:MAG TPA: peptidylprolyl isomerase [Rubricoccaceae bacterium]|nr:peptidylprolyl isomerase [Rubricoccaceae bacterium]
MRFTCLALLAFLLAARAAGAQPVPPGTVLDEIAAVVGGEIVLRSEADALAQQITPEGQPVTDEAWSRALDQLIGQRVLVTHARRDTTIVVTDEQVNQQLDDRIAYLASQLGSEDAVATYYGKTLPEIRDQFREEVRAQLLAQQLQGRRLRDVQITPAEVRAWFAQIPAEDIPEVPELVRVAHVVKLPEVSTAARERARALAEALRDSIQASLATIEDLARRHSADPGSARNGGRYDGFNVRDLVPEFGAVASTLAPGGLSGVFETAFGFHVMRLNERRGDVISFNHVLIRVEDEETDPSEAIAELRALRDSVVVHGVSFEAIARRHSEDPTSAARGGYLADPRTGERDLRLEALGPLWQAVLDTLDVGAVSAPAEVQLLDGKRAWHLVLLQRRTPAHRLGLETDYALLSEYALQEKRQRVLDEWLLDLRRSVYVDVRTPRYRPPAG